MYFCRYVDRWVRLFVHVFLFACVSAYLSTCVSVYLNMPGYMEQPAPQVFPSPCLGGATAATEASSSIGDTSQTSILFVDRAGCRRMHDPSARATTKACGAH